MRTYKTVYCVRVKTSSGSEYQYFMPSEFHLIKTMLNDGRVILGIDKEEVSPERYKSIFG